MVVYGYTFKTSHVSIVSTYGWLYTNEPTYQQ